MYAYRLRIAALAAVAAAGLAACTTPFGYGGVSVGNGYYGSNYGYSNYGFGADYGYGYGGGYTGYGYGYNAGYPGYGYGAGYPGYGLGYAPYWGWYDNYYYPGTGYYVYDRDRHPHRWTDEQQRYWNALRQQAISSKEFRQRMEQTANQQNWTGFDQGPAAAQRVQTSTGRPVRVERGIRQERVERNVQPERVERGIRQERVERNVQPERVERNVIQSQRADRSILREQRRSEARLSQTSDDSDDRSNGRRRRGNQN